MAIMGEERMKRDWKSRGPLVASMAAAASLTVMQTPSASGAAPCDPSGGDYHCLDPAGAISRLLNLRSANPPSLYATQTYDLTDSASDEVVISDPEADQSRPGGPGSADFYVHRGLTGTAHTVSFESRNHAGWYLMHYNSFLHLQQSTNTTEFKRDATFFRRDPLNGSDSDTDISFESENYPGLYIRHHDGHLKIGDSSEGAATFNDDATWTVTRWDGTCAQLAQGPSGDCLKTCRSVVDCAPAQTCDASGRCGPPPPVVDDQSGCSAAPPPAAGVAGFARWCAAALLGGAVAARRWARRRGRPAQVPSRGSPIGT
jgi:hypothetical protein